MANILYPKFKEALLDGGLDLDGGTVRVVLVDLAAYTYSAAHDFLNDVPSEARIGAPQELQSKTFVDGVFDAANVSVPAVTGPTVEAVLFYLDTGTAGTSRLIALYDTGVGLPVTPNGGAINLTFNASGIFAL